MHAIVSKSTVPAPESDDTIESLGLSGTTMMQLWSIGVARISDLRHHNANSLRSDLSESLTGYGSKKRTEEIIKDLSSALTKRRKTLRTRAETVSSSSIDHKAEELPVLRGNEPPDHALIDKMNADVPRYGGDSMQVFYRDIKRYDILSREEQMELGRRVFENKDMVARDKLVLHNLRLVLMIARKQLWATFARKKEWSALEYADLVQEGTIGLMIAAEKYDYRQGFAFSTYAYWWVEQKISRAIMDSGFIRIPVHMGELIFKVRRAMSEIGIRTGRTPTLTEVAIAVEREPKHVKAALKTMRMQLLSLDEPVPSAHGGAEEDTLLHEMIADSSALGADRILEAREELNDACARLNELSEALYEDESIVERNREAFVCFYGLDGSLRKRTLEHVGERFDITRERIRQVIQACWDKLQASGTDMDHDSVLEELSRIGELEKLTGKRVSVD